MINLPYNHLPHRVPHLSKLAGSEQGRERFHLLCYSGTQPDRLGWIDIIKTGYIYCSPRSSRIEKREQILSHSCLISIQGFKVKF